MRKCLTLQFPRTLFCQRKTEGKPIIQAIHQQKTIQFPDCGNKCHSRKQLTENGLIWFCTVCMCVIIIIIIRGFVGRVLTLLHFSLLT